MIKFRLFKETVRDNEDVLFVVAAGNSAEGRGVNISTRPRFPARYGGRSSGNDHVLTVAAHDLNGNLAHFSNFSKEFVDLLAPGCAVRVRGKDGEVTKENGTSAATAITSFVAGLIRTLGMEEPFDIKNRILVGTDFDKQFEEQAFASGKLNVVKATAVFSDVIEFQSRQLPLLFGKLPDRTAINAYCAAPPPAFDPALLRKVVLVPGADGTLEKIEFWIEVDSKLSRDTQCEVRAGSTVNFSFEKENGDTVEVSADSVREIIFASRRRDD